MMMLTCNHCGFSGGQVVSWMETPDGKKLAAHCEKCEKFLRFVEASESNVKRADDLAKKPKIKDLPGQLDLFTGKTLDAPPQITASTPDGCVGAEAPPAPSVEAAGSGAEGLDWLDGGGKAEAPPEPPADDATSEAQAPAADPRPYVGWVRMEGGQWVAVASGDWETCWDQARARISCLAESARRKDPAAVISSEATVNTGKHPEGRRKPR